MITFDRKETEQVATFLWQVLVIPTSRFANEASKLSQPSCINMSTSGSEMETPTAKMPSQTSDIRWLNIESMVKVTEGLICSRWGSTLWEAKVWPLNSVKQTVILLTYPHTHICHILHLKRVYCYTGQF